MNCKSGATPLYSHCGSGGGANSSTMFLLFLLYLLCVFVLNMFELWY